MSVIFFSRMSNTGDTTLVYTCSVDYNGGYRQLVNRDLYEKITNCESSQISLYCPTKPKSCTNCESSQISHYCPTKPKSCNVPILMAF